MLGAIEAGGTKFLCGVGDGPENLKVAPVRTTTPEETMAAVAAFFREQGPVEAVGIGSFGPIDRTSGRITSTPKAAWRDFNLVGAVRRALGVPVGFDTDVNAAALGEGRWGGGRGLKDFVYVTVGTGIGAGAVVNGELAHGWSHPEMGHLRIPHDRGRDPFAGSCPYHGDCLEGLASGPALAARWGRPGEELATDHPAWELEAHYLGLGLANVVLMLAPLRILLGGGVMRQAGLCERIGAELGGVLNGYVAAGEVGTAELGERAGVLGALILAEQAS